MDITKTIRLIAGFGVLIFASGVFADGWDPNSKAGDQGSIANTRHNMTMSYSPFAIQMTVSARNDYGAVCVYCHTPHGANAQIDAPLWNRTVANSSVYQVYDAPTTLMRTVSAPGPTSLTCLSCHDGTIAIDSVLNMPGSGWEPSGAAGTNTAVGSSNQAFLDGWTAVYPSLGPEAGRHATLGPDLGGGEDARPDNTCAFCHNNDYSVGNFRAFMLGTDLRNDHPVGVLYPDAAGVDGGFFNAPNVALPGNMAFFDTNGNNRADPDEVRLYDSGEGYEVECASCHDPHGVPSGGSGTNTRFSPSFLRVNNGIGANHTGNDGIVSNGPSALCLTCHTK
ncbi:Cytochrome c family protein [hydrothermal vent metagenome]|uniref:Cytochrome c family protein n=1 Tax=hydrothermal vent metagenome TaxID=652676 RepID=A0A3B1AJ89_9ZZZZ